MSISTVTNPEPSSTARSLKVRMVLAFFAIYFLWGTTFLAIRIAVEEMPPLYAAGMRFFIAGTVLLGFMLARRAAYPTAVQWRNLLVLSLLMFVAEYGPLFWAEQYVRPGVVSA